MSKALVFEGPSAQSRSRIVWPQGVDDDDDVIVDDESDFDEKEEPSVRQSGQWFALPGFGSPEWWAGT